MSITKGKDKVRENFLRRKAARVGLRLIKSHGKLWNYDNQLGYMIVDLYLNAVVQGSRFDLDLDEVAGHLDWYEKDLREQVSKQE